jgi:Tol biopolymer transport system component
MDGAERRRLVEFQVPRNRPIGFSWSRDARWIVFSRGGSAAIFGGNPDGDVWKMRADGTDLTNLTPDSPADDGYPSFSGDGQWIIFRRGTRGHYDLYLMRTDGSSVRRLTDGDANYLEAVFSPTANRIALLANRDDPGSVLYDVYLMELTDDLRAQSIRRITATDGQEGHLAFSPDGEWLAFASEQGGISDETPLFPEPQAYGEIYAYRLTDGKLVRLTHNKWEEGVPSWERVIPER